ncbi:MAG: lysoplasmalogenase [Leptospira sp.]|nr:lysoplasmalogenase [Leptospira sp.]
MIIDFIKPIWNSNTGIFFASFVAVSSAASIYSRYFKEEMYPLFKGIPIIGMIAFLLYHLLQAEYSSSFSTLIIVGLGLGLTGDLFLLKHEYFIHGLVAFLAGHIFYIAAFIYYSKSMHIFPYIPAISLTMIYGILLSRFLFRNNRKKYIIPVLVYSLVISFMLASGFSFDYDSNPLIPFFAIGAALFAFSDLALGLNRFVKSFSVAQLFILSTYYSAQALFAWGAYKIIYS